MNNLNNETFAVIEELSLPGQKVALRGIANSAICGAVFLAHALASWDGPTEDDGELNTAQLRQFEFFQRLPHLIQQKTELYSAAASRLGPLVQTAYDRPMDLDAALEFAKNNATTQMPADLPDQILEALGLTREQLRVIDASEMQKRQREAVRLRNSVRDHETNIRNELTSLLAKADKLDDEQIQDVIDALDVSTHAALFQKVAAKLSDGIAQALRKRDRYDGALADAMLLTQDVKTFDKAYKAFLKETAGDRDAERAAA